MSDLDQRLNAYRPDLADAALEGRVSAARFVTGTVAQVQRGCAALRGTPNHDAALATQLLFGERVTCFDQAGGWAWVQSRDDGYVGYVAAEALADPFAEATHMVATLRTFVYPAPDLKTPPLDCLSMSATVAVTGTEGRFSRIAHPAHDSACVYSAHLAARDAVAVDYTATAMQFLGTPYLWGGKDSLGLDCSGLIQVALARAGIACPRDSDMQAASIGTAVPWSAGKSVPRYGDLLYMPGHVVIALDETRMLHVNAHHMMVSIEPLADVCERIAQESGRPPEQAVDVIRRPV